MSASTKSLVIVNIAGLIAFVYALVTWSPYAPDDQRASAGTQPAIDAPNDTSITLLRPFDGGAP